MPTSPGRSGRPLKIELSLEDALRAALGTPPPEREKKPLDPAPAKRYAKRKK